METLFKLGAAGLLSCSISAFAQFDDTPPTTGAMDSGNYRNLFAEIGKSQGDIDSKVNTAVDKFFNGSGNEKLYYTKSNNESYILSTKPSGGDVRSEGMSWGLTIAVMTNKKTEFDRLWRFMHNHMKNDSSYAYPGTFGWLAQTNGTMDDQGPAPDGELYTAFALFNAAALWGNGTGVLNYEQHANDILVAMKDHLIDDYEKQIIFSPLDAPGGYYFTDPSYHIPAFFDYFADVAASDNAYWADVASESRDFLQDHYNNQYTHNGMATYLAYFNGSPAGNLTRSEGKPGDIYDHDAWRVVMNVGIDAHLSGHQSWHANIVDDQQDFFKGTHAANEGCDGQYGQFYKAWGDRYGTCGTNNWAHNIGQTSTLAAGSLGATDATDATNALNDLWNGSTPTGDHRYYPGTLYVLAMLNASGRFKIQTAGSGGSCSLNDGTTYAFKNLNSNRYLNVAGYSTNDGANIIQWGTSPSADNMKFVAESQGNGWFGLKAVHSGRFLNIASNSSADGANIIQWGTSAGYANSQFKAESSSAGGCQLRINHSNKCVNIANGSTADSANVEQYVCDGGMAEAFDLEIQ